MIRMSEINLLEENVFNLVRWLRFKNLEWISTAEKVGIYILWTKSSASYKKIDSKCFFFNLFAN